jgi:FKBP-type peptidyl-prolyl cis-trans isomerase FklB
LKKNIIFWKKGAGMRRVVWIVVGIVLLMAGWAVAEDKVSLEDSKSKVSYVIGYDVGENLKKQGVDIDPEIFMRALKDATSGNPSAMTSDERLQTMTALQQEVKKRHEEELKKAGEANKKAAEEFFAENKKKEGVVTLPSGLQYKVITEGTGKTPKATDTVTVNYRGTLLDGTEFDSSAKRGQPATFRVNGVIKGWTEALQLMKEGSKWQLFIPADLAYGARGAGRVIGPDAALVFDVELLSVKEGSDQGGHGHDSHP